MVPLSPIDNALGASRGCKRPLLDTLPASCGKRLQTPTVSPTASNHQPSPVLQPARLVCARQPGSPAARTRPAASSLVAIIGSNPCTCLPILLGRSGVGAGFPGCSSPTSQSRRRRPRDAHARTRLKALWLAAKLRQAPPRQPAECAAVVSLLTRDLRQLKIPYVAPEAPCRGALPSRACAPEAARRPAYLDTGVGTQLVPPAYATSRCRLLPGAGSTALVRV